jgi:hypothetical protein
MKTAAPQPSARMRDAAMLLPIVGLFLFMPPLITLFAGAFDVVGVPLIVVYLFAVWLALIVAAFWFARRLASEQAPVAGAAPPDGSA